MSVLCDKDLEELVDEGLVSCDSGIDRELQIGPSSIDLRLDSRFKVLNERKTEVVDTHGMKEYEDFLEEEVHDEDPICIHPNQFVLGSTIEEVEVPKNMVARVEGRSSYGRLGIIVHATAGFIDPGFKGDVTLEIQNLGNAPVKLYPGDRICQIVFEDLSREVGTAYGEKKDQKYLNQYGPTGSRLGDEKR